MCDSCHLQEESYIIPLKNQQNFCSIPFKKHEMKNDTLDMTIRLTKVF